MPDLIKVFISNLRSIFFIILICQLFILNKIPSDNNISKEIILIGPWLLYFILTWKLWKDKLSSKMALVIFLVTGLIAISFNDNPERLESIFRYKSVILLLFGIGILRATFLRLNIKSLIQNIFHSVGHKSHTPLLFLFCSFLAFPLSLAVVPIISSLLQGIIQPIVGGARIAMRAVCSTMFIAPTTIGAATVSVILPNLNWGQVIIYGLPIALSSFILTLRSNIQIDTIKEEEVITSNIWQLPFMLISVIFLSLFYISF